MYFNKNINIISKKELTFIYLFFHAGNFLIQIKVGIKSVWGLQAIAGIKLRDECKVCRDILLSMI